MNRIHQIILAAAVAATLAGCGSPTIDATTDDSYQKSLAEVREALPEEKREEFDNAAKMMLMSKLDFGAFISGAATEESMRASLKDVMHGKTADEIIADAAKLRAEREEKEREQAIVEIAELKKRQASAAEAIEQLAKFEVVRSRFYRQTSFMGSQPVIELTVKNGTSVPVSRAYFTGTLASPGRTVPWIKEDFNHQIRGGLEPGETATWRLSPNMFSEWGQVNPPADAVFTVDTVRLDGPDGEAAYNANAFSQDDAMRLAELSARYGP